MEGQKTENYKTVSNYCKLIPKFYKNNYKVSVARSINYSSNNKEIPEQNFTLL